MKDNYKNIVQDNLDRLYAGLPRDLAENLPATRNGKNYEFQAFGRTCVISPEEIYLDESVCPAILGILISLYALNARPDDCIQEPARAFKEFADSMPYAGAFKTHTEQVLVPHVGKIKERIPLILETLGGEAGDGRTGGDFSFWVYPLPKIALCYIFYEADDDFPPSVTCLYSGNARLFLTVDGLADLGEYCSKAILEIIRK